MMTIDKLLIATHNPGKFKEIKDRFVSANINIEVLSLDDLDIKDDVEETGGTFEDNAKQKAEFYYNLSKIPTMADDSGLAVDALDGEPGVKSRNWLGYRCTDEELINHLMERMEGVPPEKRTAKFVTAMVLYDGKDFTLVRGEEPGMIGEEIIPGSLPGLPYDAVFYPTGKDILFAQIKGKPFSTLSVEQKNAISHRGKAVDKIIKLLK